MCNWSASTYTSTYTINSKSSIHTFCFLPSVCYLEGVVRRTVWRYVCTLHHGSVVCCWGCIMLCCVIISYIGCHFRDRNYECLWNFVDGQRRHRCVRAGRSGHFCKFVLYCFNLTYHSDVGTLMSTLIKVYYLKCKHKWNLSQNVLLDAILSEARKIAFLASWLKWRHDTTLLDYIIRSKRYRP